MKQNAGYGNGLSIRTKVPFKTENSELAPGCDVYVNSNTSDAVQDGCTLRVPIGIGEKYNDSHEVLILNFNGEENAKEALKALQESCYAGFYAQRTPVLAMLMEYSSKINEALKTIKNSKQCVTGTLEKVKHFL